MPQMSPMNWTIWMILFIMSLYSIIMIMHFLKMTIYKKMYKSITPKIYKWTMKW